MTDSTRSWLPGFTLTDTVKEKIRASHMHPGKQGKSLFLSSDEDVVWNLVKDTFIHSVVLKPHKSDDEKEVLQKRFSSQVGNLGCNGAECFCVTVIVYKADQRIITAYPTWNLTNTFYILWTRAGFLKFANNCRDNIICFTNHVSSCVSSQTWWGSIVSWFSRPFYSFSFHVSLIWLSV